MDNAKYSNLSFYTASVPTEYTWSGYCSDIETFIDANFLAQKCNGETVYICSAENGVALGDYLSNFALLMNCVNDMERVLSPGYDYWFFKAWEQALPDYEEQDSWFIAVVELLISKGLITTVTVEETTYFVFSAGEDFKTGIRSDETLAEIERICETALQSHFQTIWEDYGDIEEFDHIEASDWALTVLERFIQNIKACNGEE